MIHYIREILRTPTISVEDVTEENDDPIEFPRLRRTGHIFCVHCDHVWQAVIQGLSRNRVCSTCTREIQEQSNNMRSRYSTLWYNYNLNYENVLAEIVAHRQSK